MSIFSSFFESRFLSLRMMLLVVVASFSVMFVGFVTFRDVFSSPSLAVGLPAHCQEALGFDTVVCSLNTDVSSISEETFLLRTSVITKQHMAQQLSQYRRVMDYLLDAIDFSWKEVFSSTENFLERRL